MIKLTSSEANKKLAELNDELSRIQKIEMNSYTFVASIQENIEDARPKYDFEETQDKIFGLIMKIQTLKHNINVFNSTTKLDCGLTIDEALVELPMLNSMKNKLNRMKMTLPKERKSAYGNGVIEYCYANYDIADVDKVYEEISLRITMIQTQLDLVNNNIRTITFSDK